MPSFSFRCAFRSCFAGVTPCTAGRHCQENRCARRIGPYKLKP
ncbi:unnamed protein product [Amoebophrya sp. A120]|nr:unnamed protein product [Amoebophrya sp. A120]|eukprot:GSA120T00015445001.1